MVCGQMIEMKEGFALNKLKLLTMSDIPTEEVQWLWYPYLPRDKITIIQGDPDEGKTTFVLALAALLTCGLPMPGDTESLPPMNIIYQTAEDGLADTVKPRLTALGADCSRVLVIDESERELTLSDHRIAQAIQETDAGRKTRRAPEAGISLPWEGASITFVWTPASAAAHQMPIWGTAPHPVEQEKQ